MTSTSLAAEKHRLFVLDQLAQRAPNVNSKKAFRAGTSNTDFEGRNTVPFRST
jgi:hypothetical protein